jgi:hypothetical protein
MIKPCEFCTAAVTADTPADQILECSICQRVYHTTCMPVTGTTADEQPGHVCTECTREGYTASTLPPQLRLYKVTFAPTEESKDRVTTYGTAAAQAQLAVIEALHAAEASKSKQDRPKKKVKFDHITAAPTERLYDVTIGQQLRRKLVIHTTPINPHTDIHPLPPTCTFAVYVRPVVCQSVDPAGEAPATTRNVACVYQQDGRCLHMLQPSAAARLSMSYLHIAQQHAEVATQHRPNTLAEALHQLCIRYKEGSAVRNKTTVIQEKHQWSMPAALHEALQTVLGCTKERFASPLNVHPATQQYWSIHPEDQLVGANYDAYKCTWTGCSIAVPDFDQHAAVKATDWARKSAMSADTPTVTVLLLPTFCSEGEDPAAATYRRLVGLHPQYCQLLFTAPGKLVELEPPANAPLSGSKPLHWQLQAIAVANKAGFRRHLPFWDREWYSDFKPWLQLHKLQPPQAALAAHLLQCPTGMHIWAAALTQQLCWYSKRIQSRQLAHLL